MRKKPTEQPSDTNGPLEDFPVHHAGRRTILHPELEREIQAQTAVRYLRFLRPVRIAPDLNCRLCRGKPFAGAVYRTSHRIRRM
jgi:hypothetical protein